MASNSGASGGRLPSSDARNLAAMNQLINSVERADSAERGSAGSSWLDERPNNWDFSSWQPSTTFDNTGARRMKKANEEKEQNHGLERERQRDVEQRPQRRPAEHFTPEEGRGNRRHTPATFPRTKGPLSQKAALENIRQELSYSDIEEVTMDTGEWNNERSMRRDVRSGLTPLQDMERNEMDPKEDEEGPDSNQIVGRLMQIRDYIKQASTMMERLRRVPDAKSREQFEKMSGIVGHLKEQEKGYLSLLQKILVSREEDVLMRQNSTTLCQETPSESEATTELDAFVINSSEDEENIARNAMSMNLNNARPMIEDRLGRHGDTDNEETINSARSSNPGTVEELAWDDGNTFPEINELLSQKSELQSYLENKNGELAALRQQQELLKQMLQQQEQLKALHGRHAALTALQEEAEQGIDSQGAAALNNEGSVKSDNPIDLGDGACGGGEDELLPQQIKELRRQVEYLKNTEQMNGSPPAKKATPPARPPPPLVARATAEPDQNATELEQLSIASTERRQLQDKLQQLQQKKEHMDSLLQELHSMRAERLVLNNEVENVSNCSSVGRMADGMLATASADHTAEEAEELLEMLEARNRLKKLQDVKERLNELKNLVQYYETGNEFIHGSQGQGQIEVHDLEEVSSLLANDFEDLPPPKNMRSLKKESQNNRRLMNDEAGCSRQRNDPSDTTETTSQVSSSAEGWNEEDPQVQEKVERLKEAKEKLRRLQELVAMVQHSPDLAHALPNDLADLAASVQDDSESQFSSQARSPAAVAVAAVSRANNISAADGAAALSFQDREQLYQRKMDVQKDELQDLMQERDRLLRVQGELQHFHDALPDQPNERTHTESVNDSSRRSVDKCTKGRNEPPRPPRAAPQDVTVTFQEPLETVVSNEELFDRMRQQRILREELRERKKELEQFMRKGNDRPRRHYGRNQDNQSDNVSYSNKSYQDGASASEDVTMATWGGSTAGNLESIEEGEAGRRMANEEPDEDDAYPSDGVVQVEEEEEANGDSDRDTYTIEEEDYRLSARRDNRHQHRSMEQPPIVETSQQARRRQQREAESLPTAPFQDGSYTFNNWSTNNQVLNNARHNTRVKSARRRRRQQRGLSAEDNPILYKMQQDIRELRSQLDSQNSPSSSEGLQHQCSQLQQQQLLMGLNHCYYQLLQQHQQLIERFGVLENYVVQQNGDSRSPRSQRPFDLDPRFPDAFDAVSDRLLTTAQSSAGSIPHKVAPKRSPLNDLSSQIPIDTIQAHDMEEPVALHLNLDDAVRPKKQKSPKSKPQDVVIGRRFPTPSRAGAAAMLAQQKTSAPYRPGLSAGISGTAFQGASSISSAMSGQDSDRLPHRREEEAPLSLFETLRETIYSEVATLISQNENRPHFLIELFRELQLLSSDYLRQRALYSIQELVTRYLTDEKVTQPKEKAWEVRTSTTNTGQPDPTSTDDEDMKHAANEISEGGDRFDYAENVATTSSISSPTSCTEPNGSWSETPFAQESLGDTVIHLDQALRRMRDYERKLATAGQADPQGASPVVTTAQAALPPREDPQSDGSMSDVPYPRIDTQQLDKQIKSIMTQIIPVLKEHMGDMCSQQLLLYIRRLVLSLAEHPPESQDLAQPPHSQEFVRFFKNQLASILQDSLAKFEGRKMRDCGEDMLVEMSEILFNELAFFRLMQDLDDPKAKVKASLKQWREDSCTSQTSTETAVTQDEPQFPVTMATQDTEEDEEEEEEVSSLTSSSSHDEDGLSSETEDNEKKAPRQEDEEEELGKTRDDAFAMEMAAMAEEKKVNIMLAPSETKPFTRIGSDEDDEGEDEVASNGEPSETAVSRDAERAAASAPSDSQSEEEKVDGPGEKDDDVEEFLTPNDLPAQLSVISKDDLASQMQEEEQMMENDLMASMTDGHVEELAGDPMALKAPGDGATVDVTPTLTLTEDAPTTSEA